MLGLSFISTASSLSSKLHDRYQPRKHKLRLPKQELSEREKGWLADIERQVHDSKTPYSSRHCVECGRPFMLITLDDMEIEYCRWCKSTWFDPSELRHFTHEPKDIPSDDSKSRVSERKCPDCGAYMREYVYLKPFWVLVDRCPNGHGIYLQDKELEQIFELT